MQCRSHRGGGGAKQTQERNRAVPPRYKIRYLWMILDASRVAIGRPVVRHIHTVGCSRARSRADFFRQHATATVIPTWEIYHGASNFNLLGDLIAERAL